MRNWAPAVAVLLAGAPASAQDIFLVGGMLVDPATETVSSENLLILGGAIAGRPDEPPAGFAGRVLDVSSKWVIPGLHDLHVHANANPGPGARERLGPERTAQRMLWAGVTGYLDLFNLEEFIFTVRDRQRGAAEVTGADIFAAGPCLTGSPPRHYGWPSRAIDTPEDARREVGELALARPDGVKLIYEHKGEGERRAVRPTFDRQTLEAAVAAAAAHGLPTVVHVRSWRDVRESVLAGATAITHIPWQPMPEDIVGLMAERGTFLMPTLDRGDPAFWTRQEVLDSPFLRAMTTPAVLDAYRRDDLSEGTLHQRMIASQLRVRGERLKSVKTLSDAGVPILSGSDSGNLGTVLGYSLHHELAVLVEAGLGEWQALAASTTLAGELLGRPWGLSPGDEGSVVVLEASPLEDIANTSAIAAVVHHGVLVDREDLARRMFGSPWSGAVVAGLVKSLPTLVAAQPPARLLIGSALLIALAVGALAGALALARAAGRSRGRRGPAP